ncbi:helix-turn-helix domain-containing protein [Actinomadura scrupuli]|uniref:helix-turn-helix domain-containing protein n=1 Tax=Actinomadura scrupuli TaxID=559629 RepID=UPI003D977565
MTEPRQSPTLRRRRLSAELCRLREQAGLTQTEVTKRLEWSQGKLARMERGEWLRPDPHDIRLLLDQYGVTDERQREQLIVWAREGRQRGWWHPYKDMLSATLSTYIGLEAEATSLHTFQLIVVPGLLQTVDYARGLISRGPEEISEEDVERKVEVRTARQELLTRIDDPLRLWAVMDEAALRRPVAGPETMRAQMQHLLELARLPKVTLQVIPFSAGAHPGTAGAFSLLEFPHPDDPEAAYVETVGGELFVENREEVKEYQLAFRRLTAFAADPANTLELIAEMAST